MGRLRLWIAPYQGYQKSFYLHSSLPKWSLSLLDVVPEISIWLLTHAIHTCFRFEQKLNKNKKEVIKHLETTHGQLATRINHLERKTRDQISGKLRFLGNLQVLELKTYIWPHFWRTRAKSAFIWDIPYLNIWSWRKRGSASNPKMEYQVLSCIFH